MRSPRGLRVLWLALLLALTGPACSSAPDGTSPRQVATPAAGSPEVAGGTSGERSKKSSSPGRDRRSRPGRARFGVPDSSSEASDPSGSTTPGRRPAAAASASRADPSGDPDRSGEVPAYTDIRRASLRGSGRALKLILRVDGDIERSFADGTDMSVNFRLDRRGDRDHQIYAIGTSEGWRADLDNSGSFPGRFAIVGDSFVFELGWSHLGGEDRFLWEAETAWTRSPSGPLGQTEFSFDRVPEYEAARYPE